MCDMTRVYTGYTYVSRNMKEKQSFQPRESGKCFLTVAVNPERSALLKDSGRDSHPRIHPPFYFCP